MGKKFRDLDTLEIVEEDWNKPIPVGPADELKHGHLENGMRYFVRHCNKPKNRAALALAVNIGSVVEEDDEQGLAHVVEHLAFNATENFSNHDIVKFLESIGAEFGACQNAYTSADETVFELVVPTDDDSSLSTAMSVFSEFATKIRCSAEDLQKERGAVMEEWRLGRDSRGRTGEAQWKLIMKGCKYADRMPIGLEKIIQHAPSQTVKAFYERWYRPENMAIIATGDLDAEKVVEIIKQQLGKAQSSSPQPDAPIPTYSIASHEEPRYSALIDKENQQPAVNVTWKHPARQVATPAEYLDVLKDNMFNVTMNNRLFKISRQHDPPFYSAQVSAEPLCRSMSCYGASAFVPDTGYLEGLEALLTELARARLHGFSEREVEVALALEMSEVESMYAERDQIYAEDMRGEYVRHFLTKEAVVGREEEVRLNKTLLPMVRPEHLQAIAGYFKSCCSCVVKAVSHHRVVTEEQLAEVVARVDKAEAEGHITPWEEADVPSALLEEEPEPGSIVSEKEIPILGGTELTLSNGMKVFYKSTDFLEDQVLVSGFAAGGLSEVPQENFRTCSLASMLTQELGTFGLRPEVIVDILMGKRVDIHTNTAAYWRSLGGEQSPQDLECAFQLIYRLFTTQIQPREEDLVTCMSCLRDNIAARVRNPLTSFSERVRFINYGRCYYFEPPTLPELDHVDAAAACRYFSEAFQNPAEFRLCLTGNLTDVDVRQLIETYLASIPESNHLKPRLPSSVTALPFTFPEGVVREDVRANMVMPRTQSLITFPVEISSPGTMTALQETHWLGFACQLLETKLLQLMRFKFGEVYTVSISPFFGAEAPSRQGSIRGDVGVGFSCDPHNAQHLIELALAELERLQAEGPTDDEIKTLLTLEARAHETSIQENSFWHDMAVTSYQSRMYHKDGDVDKVFTLRQEAREIVREAVNPRTLQDALRRLFPHPCRSRYTAITLLPRAPLLSQGWAAISSVLPAQHRSLSYWISLGAAALLGAAFIALRSRPARRRS